jgi:hypothetical protein
VKLHLTSKSALTALAAGCAEWQPPNQTGWSAGKAINHRISASPRRVTYPRKLEPAATEWRGLHCPAMGCESGRQDSNLRPLVPETSPLFRMRIEFDLEWLCGELVGMTTGPCSLASV